MLVTWFHSVSAGIGFSQETIRRFGEGDQYFETARSQHLLGAAPYAEISHELAVGHYAARFVAGKKVFCVAQLPNVAALLSPSAACVALGGIDPEHGALLRAWFGDDFVDVGALSHSADLAIIAGEGGDFAEHLAPTGRIIDALGVTDGQKISIAPGHAVDDLVRLSESAVKYLTTSCVDKAADSISRIADAPVAAGGSHGRILFVLREDALRAPGADTDEAYALRKLLLAEGFHVDIAVRPDLYEPAHYDLVHGFGLLSSPATLIAFQRAEKAKVPTVLTAFFEDVAEAGWWGTRASRSLLDLVADEESSQRMLRLLSERRVYVDDVSAVARFDNGEEASRKALLRQADFVITHSEAEREAIESYAGRTEFISQSLPTVYREHARVSVSHLVPDQAYMFVQAPVEARQNVGLVLYAASALDIPCVFAGPILDRRLYRHIAARVGTNIVMVPESTPAELASMCEGAAVYLDAAWIGDGSSRIMRALMHGVVPVVSERRHLDARLEAHVVRVDPASFDSLRNGMSNAWQRAGTPQSLLASKELQAAYDPATSFKTVIAAYVTARERRNSLVS